MATSVYDSSYSWIVAIGGSVTYFIMYGLARVSGMLFVATLNYYKTDRETASFPFTLGGALRYLVGPLAGYIAGKWGIQNVILLGCVLTCIGCGACFLADNILMVAILWGGLFGIGSGFSTSLTPQMNNLYFNKHLTKANGISYAGAAIAGFVLPPIVEVFLNEYGIRGTYLLLSGIALHAIPAVIFLKEPKPEEICAKESKKADFEIPENVKTNNFRRFSDISVLYDHTKSLARRLQDCSKSTQGTAIGVEGMSSNNILNMRRRSSLGDMLNSRRSSLGDILNSRRSSTSDRLNSLYTERNIHNLNPTQESAVANLQNILYLMKKDTEPLPDIKEGEPLDTSEIVENNPEPFSIYSKIDLLQGNDNRCYEQRRTSITFTTNDGSCQDNPGVPKSVIYVECSETIELPNPNAGKDDSCLRDFSIFLDPQYFIIAFTASINGFYCFVLPTILTDFCWDKGINLNESTYLLVAFSIFDTVGRLGFGWVTDSRYMTVANFCAVCFFLMGVCLLFVVWSSEFISMLIILSLLGLGLGVHTPLPAGLVTDYIKPEKHTMANSSYDFFSVPFLLSASSMIGYFRDYLGSYDWYVYILSIISFICGIMMFILPCIGRRKRNKEVVISEA